MAKVVSVVVVSDIMCPWCWIGKRHIELAAQKIGEGLSLELQWKPYQLDSKIPAEGVDKVTYFKEHYGPQSLSWFMTPDARPTMAGRAVGLNYVYHEGCKVANTRSGHKLMAFALQHGGIKLQNNLQEVLFRKYFSDGQNLGDKEVLLAATDEVGIDRTEAGNVLTPNNDYDRHIDEEMANARKRGVSGVPNFTFPNREVISGGTPVEEFERILRDCMRL